MPRGVSGTAQRRGWSARAAAACRARNRRAPTPSRSVPTWLSGAVSVSGPVRWWPTCSAMDSCRASRRPGGRGRRRTHPSRRRAPGRPPSEARRSTRGRPAVRPSGRAARTRTASSGWTGSRWRGRARARSPRRAARRSSCGPTRETSGEVQLPELREPLVDGRADRPGLHRERSRDLVVGEVVIEARDDHPALALRQLAQCRQQISAVGDRLVGARPGTAGGSVEPVALPAKPAPLAEELAGPDDEQPRPGAVDVSEPVTVRFHEGLLCGVLRRLPVAAHGGERAEQPRVLEVVELPPVDAHRPSITSRGSLRFFSADTGLTHLAVDVTLAPPCRPGGPEWRTLTEVAIGAGKRRRTPQEDRRRAARRRRGRREAGGVVRRRPERGLARPRRADHEPRGRVRDGDLGRRG